MKTFREIQMKTSELTGNALNYAVAKAQGFDVYKDEMLNGHTMPGFWVSGYYPGDLNSWIQLEHYTPSTSWMKGGPIIEREKIRFDDLPDGGIRAFTRAKGKPVFITDCWDEGITPLIAAMRCFVASRLGDDVEIPKELL
jgi:hypothetical protein